jgi:hypothetical protein
LRQAITLLLIFPFMAFFMFQPFMSEVVHMRGVVLEQTVHKYAKLAAREGNVSPSLIVDLKNELSSMHFKLADLTVAGTTSVRVSRGSTINLNLEYPMGSLFIFANWFGSDPSVSSYKFTASEMSEYIP